MLSIVLILTFLFIFLKPSIAFDGASTGLLLWFHTVLPTLFPFFILNSLFKNSGTMFYLSKLVSPILSPLFRISNCSSYAVLCGWLCGTPVGAKIAADLVQSQKISEEETTSTNTIEKKAIKECPNCGANIDLDFDECEYCNTKIN